jgi:hypothetical protein
MQIFLIVTPSRMLFRSAARRYHAIAPEAKLNYGIIAVGILRASSDM